VYHGGPNDDPVEWFDEIERLSTANGYDAAYKQRVIGAYLKGTAATWYDTDQGNIQNWAEDNDNSFKRRFMNQFRTNNRIIQWRRELEKRVQLPGETVEQYAKDIKRLIKRIDPQNDWEDTQKVYSFTKGLKDDTYRQLAPVLTMQANPTLNVAIEVAQKIEEVSRQTSVTSAPAFAVPASQALPDLTQLINESVKKAVEAAFAERRARYNSNAGQGNQGTRPPFICYRCQKPGHKANACTEPAKAPEKPAGNTQSLLGGNSDTMENVFSNNWSLNY